MPVIANTTVISNFAVVQRLELLRMRFGRLHISDHVFDEIQNGLSQGYTFYEDIEAHISPFSSTGWLHLTSLTSSKEFQSYGNLLNRLHSGEASCLSIARHRQWTFLSDDKMARKIGKEFDVPISGTLGILLSATRRKIIAVDDAEQLLQKMVLQGYYSPVSSLKDILTE